MANTDAEFAVGYFPEEDIYSELPVNWLTPRKMHCWWPKAINVGQLIAKKENPNKKKWQICQVQIQSYCCKFTIY